MVDIFEEVDEELRRDKYQDLLRRYGPWVLGAALAIVVVAAGYQGWTAWRASQMEASSERFAVAMRHAEAGRLDRAASGFDSLAEDGTGGYRTLALLQRGAIALESGDRAAAANYYERAARATGEPLLGDIAELRAVWALWDELSFADIEIRLMPLTGAQAPYRHLARETIGAAALRAGDLARARSAYQALSFGLETPEALRRRSQEALARIEQLGGVPAAAEAPAPAESVPAADTPVESTTDSVPTDVEEAGDD